MFLVQACLREVDIWHAPLVVMYGAADSTSLRLPWVMFTGLENPLHELVKQFPEGSYLGGVSFFCGSFSIFRTDTQEKLHLMMS